ncbi:MAG: hypothetical protein ACM30E_08355 [Nitrososphaerales archaeon]
MKTMGLTWPDHAAPGFEMALAQMNAIAESAHTPQGAFGYMLSRMRPRRSLRSPVTSRSRTTSSRALRTVCGSTSLEDNYPVLGQDLVYSTDLLVLKVKKGKHGRPPKIEQFIGDVSDYTWGPFQNVYGPMADPKYPEPTSQLDRTNLIEPGANTYCANGY